MALSQLRLELDLAKDGLDKAGRERQLDKLDRPSGVENVSQVGAL